MHHHLFNLIRNIHLIFFSLISVCGIACFDLGRHEFEGLHATLVVGLEKVDLGELGAQIVRLSNGFEDFEDVIEFLVGLKMSPVEGDITFCTAG